MEACRVITPCGSFEARWSEDEDEPVSYAGEFGGIAYFRNFLETELVSRADGRRIAFHSLEPEELRGFCDSDAYGIFVQQDLSEVEELDAGQVVALDSVSDDPATEAMAIIDKLNSGEGDRTELCNRLAFLLPQVEFYNADEEEAFQEAAAQAMGKE